MSEPVITYCDDYEAITGKKIPVVETKVVSTPEFVAPVPATVAETA